MAGIVAVGMLLQFILVTSRKPERMLIPAQTVTEPGM
jgi:hypothetical protein